MPNPVLNDKMFAKTETQPGWAAPDPALANEAAAVRQAPIDDGPITPYDTAVMTMNGAVTAIAVLFALLLVGSVFGWRSVTVFEFADGRAAAQIPGWIFLPLLGGLGLVILTVFRPKLARITAPLYALVQGVVVGAISHVYEVQWDGIVLQAAGATMAVMLVTLAMYALRIVRVTNRFRNVVIAATFGLMLFYVFSIVLRLFGVEFAFITQPSLFGIGFSIFAAGLAAFNLFLDYDVIERGVNARAPKYMEWFAALGLMVTLVWLYLEMLRLLAKLRSR
jgi:uncharacterized YccA/Bax inhibitor family protein